MAFFEIKALGSDGKSYKETVEAEGKLELYQLLKKQGHTLISATEKKSWFKSGSLKSWWPDISFGASVKDQEIITATENLSAMLAAGLSLSKSVSILNRQTKNKKFKTALESIQARIESGDTFSSALESQGRVFSDLFIAMVKAGEEGGNLSGSLDTVSIQMAKAEALRKRVKGAMIYPSIILTVMVVIAVLMLTFIVPTLTETFDDLGVDLPPTTQFVVTVSGLLVDHTLVLIGLIFLIGFGFYYSLKTRFGKRFVDFTILHLPVIGGIAKEVNAARTARTMSSLLSSGVDMVTALSITQDVVQNSYYKPVIALAEEGIKKGEPVSKVFIDHEHLYPVLVGEMMAVGEEVGKIDEMLLRIAEFFENEVEQKTKDVSTIIEPVLMVVIGVGVGFFAISMLTPMYSIMEQI